MVTKSTKTKNKSIKDSDTIQANSVPFDPGFAPFVLSFMESYEFLNAEVRKFKNVIQRKMKYRSFEQPLFKLLDNITSFISAECYTGHILLVIMQKILCQ